MHNVELRLPVKSNGTIWICFAGRYPGRRLSTGQTTAASCPTALGTLCGQLTFRLAWCCKHSAVTATELLQARNLACGTLFRSSCAIQTLFTDCSDDSRRDSLFGNHEHGALWLLICWRHRKHLLTDLLLQLSAGEYSVRVLHTGFCGVVGQWQLTGVVPKLGC